MDSEDLLLAVQAFLAAQSGPTAALNITTWLDDPPLPYPSSDPAVIAQYVGGNPYPFAAIAPRTQTSPAINSNMYQQSGFVRVTYADVLGRTTTSPHALKRAARLWIDLLASTIRGSYANTKLTSPSYSGGAVWTAGTENEGMVAAYDEQEWAYDERNHKVYLLPLDIFVTSKTFDGF